MKKSFSQYKCYWPVILLALVMIYCYANTPLCFDQFVADKLYIKNGGFGNWVTGYCWYWVCNVNGRFFSTIICGVLEQNIVVNRISMMVFVAAMPLMGIKAFGIRKEQKKIYLLFGCVSTLAVCRALQTEVYFYAGLLYCGAVLLVEWIAILLPSVLDEKKCSAANGTLFLAVCMIASLWVENLTSSLLVVLICIAIYHYVFSRKLNGYLFAAIGIAGASLAVMGDARGGSVIIQHKSLEGFLRQMLSVLDSAFYENAAITALICFFALICIYGMIKESKGKRLRLFWTLISIILFYLDVVYAARAYNLMVDSMTVLRYDDPNVMPTALPKIASTFLLPSVNGVIRLFSYIVLIAVLLIICATKEKNREYLTTFGVSMCSIGVLCVVGVYFGQRIISPGVCLLFITMAAAAADSLSKNEESIQKKNQKSIKLPAAKIVSVVFTVLFLLMADEYYARFTQIGEINRVNQEMIQSVVELQRMDLWDYDADVLKLRTLHTDLFCPNIPEGDPHYPSWCAHYGLREETHVLYY